MLALFSAIGCAFFLDYLDDTLKTPEEIERYLRLPTLAFVPNVISTSNGTSPARVEVSSWRARASACQPSR